MPRQPVTTKRNPGIEWSRASVDAPDAYHRHGRARYQDGTVVVFDQKWVEVGTYVLDEPVVVRAGVLAGMVDGAPIVVQQDCNCPNSYQRTPK